MIPGMGCREVSLFLEKTDGNLAGNLQALLDTFGFISCGVKCNQKITNIVIHIAAATCKYLTEVNVWCEKMMISFGNSNEIIIQIKIRFLIHFLPIDEQHQIKQLAIYKIYSPDHNL